MEQIAELTEKESIWLAQGVVRAFIRFSDKISRVCYDGHYYKHIYIIIDDVAFKTLNHIHEQTNGRCDVVYANSGTWNFILSNNAEYSVLYDRSRTDKQMLYANIGG